ncbi:MAG: hypothetical protein GY754_23075 [bacterium]|nr:hypothetical protein [bacterium]
MIIDNKIFVFAAISCLLFFGPQKGEAFLGSSYNSGNIEGDINIRGKSISSNFNLLFLQGNYNWLRFNTAGDLKYRFLDNMGQMRFGVDFAILDLSLNTSFILDYPYEEDVNMGFALGLTGFFPADYPIRPFVQNQFYKGNVRNFQFGVQCYYDLVQ